MEHHEVRHVVTGIRGRESKVEIDIEEEETYCVSCPNQSVVATKTRKRWKESFDPDTCRECSVSESCPTQQLKSCRAFYFTRNDFLARKRWKNLQKIPEERRKLRPNVEATINEFTGAFNHKGKLPYRGRFSMLIVIFLLFWQKVAGCWLLVVGKKTFTFFEIEQLFIFRVCPHSSDSLAVHQQPATSNKQLLFRLVRLMTEVYAFCTAIGINFGRVVRHRKRKCRQEEVESKNLSPMLASAIRKMLKFTFSPLKKFAAGIKKDFCSLFTQNERLLSVA